MRFFACISYDGSKLHGWQKQETTAETVQSYIEKTLSMLLRAGIETTGCGRTDAGVHAIGYYLHFDHSSTFNYRDVAYHANKILPSAIAIHHIVPVEEGLHARYDALSRAYVYKIKLHKNPFLSFHTEWNHALTEDDFAILQELATCVKDARDFICFCKTGSDVENHLCEIYEAYWTWNRQEHTLCFHIRANRFLRGMIRLLTGMMMNVVRGKVSMDEAKAALFQQVALKMSWSAPAAGLCLHSVDYGRPYLPPIHAAL